MYNNIEKQKCLCQQCLNNEFNIEDFLVNEGDFKILDNDRPLGISGHMRVRNEAMSVGECIESCIDFLDELIITYNTSTDDTEQILEEYQNKYKDKIRLYHYKPNLISIKDYVESEFNTKYSKVHYLSNYYNFGYVKIKYKYYMKIDADQIYFTEKLLSVREAILKDISSYYLKINNIDTILWWLPIRKLRYKLRSYFYKKVKSYYLKNNDNNIHDTIINNKIKNNSLAFNMGGFNLVLYKNNFYLKTDKQRNIISSYVFNGCVGDHLIWIPKSNSVYFMSKEGWETIRINYNILNIGFCWLHLGYIKRNYQINILETSLISYMDIIRDTNINNKIIDCLESVISDYFRKTYSIFFYSFFDIDKKYITKDFCDKFLKKPLEYAIKHFNIE